MFFFGGGGGLPPWSHRISRSMRHCDHQQSCTTELQPRRGTIKLKASSLQAGFTFLAPRVASRDAASAWVHVGYVFAVSVLRRARSRPCLLLRQAGFAMDTFPCCVSQGSHCMRRERFHTRTPDSHPRTSHAPMLTRDTKAKSTFYRTDCSLFWFRL